MTLRGWVVSFSLGSPGHDRAPHDWCAGGGIPDDESPLFGVALALSVWFPVSRQINLVNRLRKVDVLQLHISNLVDAERGRFSKPG